MTAEVTSEIVEAAPSDLVPECSARECREAATHALVFRPHCRCADRGNASWLLCAPHVERGLQELRERFEWRCDTCGFIGFWCTPVRVEPLS